MNLTEYTRAWAESRSQAWVDEHVDPDEAILVHKRWSWIPNNVTKLVRYELPPYGTFRMDPLIGELDVLIQMRLDEFEPSERDWDFALRHFTTRQYVEWMKKGHMPPPVSAVQNRSTHDGTVKINSLNRRRWLAAREVGWDWLPCWYSPTHPVRCASSVWWMPEHAIDQRHKLSFARKQQRLHDKPLTDSIGRYELQRFGVEIDDQGFEIEKLVKGVKQVAVPVKRVKEPAYAIA